MEPQLADETWGKLGGEITPVPVVVPASSLFDGHSKKAPERPGGCEGAGCGLTLVRGAKHD